MHQSILVWEFGSGAAWDIAGNASQGRRGSPSFAVANMMNSMPLICAQQRTPLSGTLTNRYGYDAASNRVSFTSSESGITNYSYDSLNRLTTLTDPNTGSFGFGYDALGRRTSLTRPNGVGTSYSYDTLSRLLSVLHNGGALPGSTSYTYDAAGWRRAAFSSATRASGDAVHGQDGGIVQVVEAEA